MDQIVAALMGRVAEFSPEQLRSLETLLQHSQKNIDTDQLVDMGNDSYASSYTVGIGDDRGERLVPSAWDGKILEGGKAYDRAMSERDDWPVFEDIGRGERAADLAHVLMMFQQKQDGDY